MAIITLPPIAANSMQLQLIRGDNALEFFGGSEVIIASTKAIWVCTVNLRPQKPDNNGREWFAALTQLSNLENTALIEPPGIVRGTNFSGPNPVVFHGAQLGLSLTFAYNSLPPFPMALRGDFLSVNGEFKILTQDIIIPQNTVHFEPALRQSPPPRAEIDVKTPKMTVRLATATAGMDTLLSGFYNMNVTFIETFRI